MKLQDFGRRAQSLWAKLQRFRFRFQGAGLSAS